MDLHRAFVLARLSFSFAIGACALWTIGAYFFDIILGVAMTLGTGMMLYVRVVTMRVIANALHREAERNVAERFYMKRL
jgi:hypothetical protein